MIWRNWAGNVASNPADVRIAGNEQEILNIVEAARKTGQTIRPTGTGHSFSGICATDGVLVSLEERKVCHLSEESVATFWAGTRIGTAAEMLWNLDRSFANQGDIDVQSMAGAIGTGTHGTGRSFGSFSAATKTLRLITADGDIRVIDQSDGDGLLQAAALSVGMLGLISEVSIEVCPAYCLREETQALAVDECLDLFGAVSEKFRNPEFYWVPGLDRCVLKTIDLSEGEDIIDGDSGELPPPGTMERYLRPVRVHRAYRVFRNIRTVPFVEMEYSVPLDAGLDCFREIRDLMRRKFPEKSWVVEYRTQREDDRMLSPAWGREVATISVHDEPGATGSDRYFRACEEIFVACDGRPHWGKLCYLSPTRHADRFPAFSSFSGIRQRLDPDGMFLNDYLRPLFR